MPLEKIERKSREKLLTAVATVKHCSYGSTSTPQSTSHWRALEDGPIAEKTEAQTLYHLVEEAVPITS